MEQLKGAFSASLKRNNKQIRDDRAMVIVNNAQLTYKRLIEDLEMNIQNMEIELDNMLDLSPTNAQSLIMAADFKAAEYVAKDLKVGLDIRNERIKLNVAKRRFAYLFTDGAIPAEEEIE